MISNNLLIYPTIRCSLCSAFLVSFIFYQKKVCQTVYKHFSKTDEIDAARAETIQRVAAYVKDHPRARPAEIQSKVDEEITLFKLKLTALGV